MGRKLTGWLSLACLPALLACSPTLNWREARLDRLRLLLPCKPETAQRTLQLGQQTQPLDMMGCEAAGALFAVSRIRAQQEVQASQITSAWRAASLANLHSTSSTDVPWLTPVAGVTGTMLNATGASPQGNVIQARLVWLVAGDDVFHIAVYAPRITPELTDTLLSDIKLQ
jgi:hypothetical protein